MPRRESARVALCSKGWCLRSNTPLDAPLNPESAPLLHASLLDLTAPPMAGNYGPGHVEHEKKTFFS
jgi:hypothetical protein